MFPGMDAFTKQAEGFTKEWERSAQAWWDQALRSRETLEAMGAALGGMCAARERSDRALEQAWAAWRLPSASDVERVYERLGEVQEQLGEVAGRLAALEERLDAGAGARRDA